MTVSFFENTLLGSVFSLRKLGNHKLGKSPNLALDSPSNSLSATWPVLKKRENSFGSNGCLRKSKNSQYTAHQLDLDAKQRQRSQQTAQELQDAEARMPGGPSGSRQTYRGDGWIRCVEGTWMEGYVFPGKPGVFRHIARTKWVFGVDLTAIG